MPTAWSPQPTPSRANCTARQPRCVSQTYFSSIGPTRSELSLAQTAWYNTEAIGDLVLFYHNSLALPWWIAVLCTTLTIRLGIALPIAVWNARSSEFGVDESTWRQSRRETRHCFPLCPHTLTHPCAVQRLVDAGPELKGMNEEMKKINPMMNPNANPDIDKARAAWVGGSAVPDSATCFLRQRRGHCRETSAAVPRWSLTHAQVLELQQEMRAIYKKHGTSPLAPVKVIGLQASSFRPRDPPTGGLCLLLAPSFGPGRTSPTAAPGAQAFISGSIFVGLRHLVSADLPSMNSGGTFWFPDLTEK